MTLFKNAVNSTPRLGTTHNGAVTNTTSLDPLVDLFFVIGAARNIQDNDLFSLFERSFANDPVHTVKMLFWARDVRGGAGERRTFIRLMKYLVANHKDTASKVALLISEFGRWKDVREIFDVPHASAILAIGLSEKNGLAAKWTPRSGPIFNAIRKHFKMTPKQLRKLLVSLTNVVEQKMCARQWTEINYSHVPSVAAAMYQKAFFKHDPEGYKKYRDELVKPVVARAAGVKINASAIFPHDVLKAILLGDREVGEAQWEALPNYLGDARVLPMCDVSGSMTTSYAASNIRPLDVSISLGLYISEKQKGDFKDMILTFSDRPVLEELKGSVWQRAQQIQSNLKPYNTDLEVAYKEILRIAVNNKLKQEDLPEYLLIISDMEFDSSSIRGKTVFQTARGYYEAAGYKMPKVVFWNLNGRKGNNPVTIKDADTALVSGFSPAVLKAILSGDLEEFTPRNIVLQSINTPRYTVVEEALKATKKD